MTTAQNIPDGWWLNHNVCKKILASLVHKDNTDIMTSPTQQPPDLLCVDARERKEKTVEDKRAAAKADCPVEEFGNLDHQLKKV